MNDKSMTGNQLEQALLDQKLGAGAAPLIGMVKKSEKLGHVAFTRTGCDTWVDIPVEMIERAEHIGQQTCKDHAHPVMRLTLKSSENPQEQILMALLSQEGAGNAMPPSRLDLPGTSSSFPGNPGVNFAPGLARFGGGLGGLGGGLIPPGFAPLALGCTECQQKTLWQAAGGGGVRTCAYLVCTTIGDFHLCQVRIEEEGCLVPWGPVRAW